MNPWIARASSGLLLGCSLGLAQDPASGQVLAPYKWESRNREAVHDRLVLYNELAQLYLANSKAAAIPHVMVFRDSDGFDPAPGRGHHVKRRLPVGDYPVGPELEDWLQQGLPLWHLETLIGESAGEPPRFDGRWRSSERRNPDQVAESLEIDVIPLSTPERFRIALREDGEPSSVRFGDATRSHPRKLKFTAREDSTTATAECVLSLDARLMRIAFTTTDRMGRTMVLERIDE